MTDSIYFANTNFLNQKEIFDGYLKLVGEDRRRKTEKLKLIDDKKRSLCAELLLLHALSDNGFSIEKISYGHNEYGKPYIKELPDFHFNISHSGDYVICGVSDSDVGCDIERVEHTDINIAKRFFRREEYEDILSGNSEELFIRYWTLKESYIKCVGKGLNMSLSDFRIELSKEIKVYEENELKDFSFAEFSIDKRYKCAFCKKGGLQNVDLKEIFIKNRNFL